MTNIKAQKYDVIGLMSGTSLDGLDVVFCRFYVEKKSWKFEILNAETLPYSEDWLKKLSTAESLTALEFHELHNNYGLYLGKCVLDFITKYSIKSDFVSSHGHTIFHQPEKKITTQIGSGAAIASICKLPVVNDFRTLDVFLGGQGAPLVPIGDRLLFNEYDYCLNLGGFANISYENNKERIAFDICPVNIVMNQYAKQLGHNFDNKGDLAKNGKLNRELLNKLNELEFYHLPYHQPKSLGKEWVLKNIFPLIDDFSLDAKDVLHTFAEHIAVQINKVIIAESSSKILVTGGGAYNQYLMELLQQKCKAKIILPDSQIIEFKEALIFAFLGVLRMRNEINCLRSVTGASSDSCGGAIYNV